jgi:hypothetical protein
VFATVKVPVALPCRETEPVTDRPLVWNVVYERPKPKVQRGLYPEPWPEFVPGSWSKNFGASPASTKPRAPLVVEPADL